ncbi:MAG TPA: heme o synthase [Gemmatimonadaceae bacterium]|nr:heme o synthase [Gemmatimonadaceae bacterium]
MAVTEIGIANRRARVSDFFELAKPRITFLVLIATAVGFYMGSEGALQPFLLLHAIVGTALVAAGASAFNEYLERDLDARMVRTRTRPIPDGRITPNDALIFSIVISAAGIAYLALLTNLLTAAIGAATLAAYVLLYTPLKTRTTWCTLIGAFPGATPPLMGYVAAHGNADLIGLSFFAIQFLWQMPHFFAIAWMFTEDYLRAGFRVHSRGVATGRQIILYCSLLIPVSMLPVLFGSTGRLYLMGALLLGFVYLGYGFSVALFRSQTHAQRLLRVSVLYLPALFLLMMIDKV